MEKLEVRSIKLSTDGVLRIATNIVDNLELAKHVSKDRMEKCLNNHHLEMHIYQDGFNISSIMYKGKFVTFDINDFYKFLEENENKKKV